MRCHPTDEFLLCVALEAFLQRRTGVIELGGILAELGDDDESRLWTDQHSNGWTADGRPAPAAEHSAVAYAASHSAASGEPTRTPRAALVLTCNGRGVEHHGTNGAETKALEEVLRPSRVPIAGFFAAGELGPLFGPRAPREVDEGEAEGAGGLLGDASPSPPHNDWHQFSAVVALLGS